MELGWPVAQWIPARDSATVPLLGDSMSVPVARTRRTARVIGTKPGWVLVRYWL